MMSPNAVRYIGIILLSTFILFTGKDLRISARHGPSLRWHLGPVSGPSIRIRGHSFKIERFSFRYFTEEIKFESRSIRRQK